MRRTCTALAIVTSIGAVPLAAHAQTSRLADYGQQTCRQWLEIRQTPAQAAAADSWVLGYVEAVAKLSDASRAIKGLPAAETLKGLDGSTVIALMERNCRGNPRRTVDEAIGGLSAQLVASEPMTVQGPVR